LTQNKMLCKNLIITCNIFFSSKMVENRRKLWSYHPPMEPILRSWVTTPAL
jgi:hypothetical protein